MSKLNPYFTSEEQTCVDQFLKKGFVTFPFEKFQILDQVRSLAVDEAFDSDLLTTNTTVEEFFNFTHNYIPVQMLNDYRVRLIQRLKDKQDLLPHLYHLARKELGWLLGSEIAMQRSANISVQLPQDTSSILPLHSDVWSGNSPYEVVLWIPLTDVYKTRSMFILPMEHSQEIYKNFAPYAQKTAEEFYKSIEKEIEWIEIPYGHGLIFSHTLPHGNRVNLEPMSRWSINIRFKALLSPYGSKEIGETFFPITMRPATRIGFSYRNPEC